MESLFNDQNYVATYIDPYTISQQLFKLAGSIQNTDLSGKMSLYGIFTPWYIQCGPYKVNGGKQPYSQRYLLRQLINDADSCFQLEHPGAQLRYGYETCLLLRKLDAYKE